LNWRNGRLGACYNRGVVIRTVDAGALVSAAWAQSYCGVQQLSHKRYIDCGSLLHILRALCHLPDSGGSAYILRMTGKALVSALLSNATDDRSARCLIPMVLSGGTIPVRVSHLKFALLKFCSFTMSIGVSRQMSSVAVAIEDLRLLRIFIVSIS